MWTKRRFILSSCCAACAGLDTFVSQASSQRFFEGCFISAEGFQAFGSSGPRMKAAVDGLFRKDQYARTTGDPELDRKLDEAMRIAADLFGVKPAFGIV